MRIRGLFLAVLGLAASSLAVAQMPASAPAPVAPDPQNILNLDLSSGGRVQVYGCSPGCLLVSLLISVFLTLAVNGCIRLF